MRQLRETPSRGQAKEIENRIDESGRERGRELREAGRLRWGGVVDWGQGKDVETEIVDLLGEVEK